MPTISRDKLHRLQKRQKMLANEVLMYQRVMEGLRKNLKFESLLKLIIQSVCEALGFKRGGIFLLEPGNKTISLALGMDQKGRFEKGTSRFQITQEKGINGFSDIVNGYKKYYLTNLSRKRIPNRVGEEELTVYNNAAVPIEVGRGRVVGVLAVDNLNVNRFITKLDVATLLNYATQIGLAVESFWSHEKILNQSITDPMTGLFNRRFFEQSLEEEIKRCRRYDRSCGLIMADIDFFKKVNDTFGHEAGDEVIKQIAGLLKENTRSLDIVARLGGEEFAVLMPETQLSSMDVFTQRLLKKVRETLPPIEAMRRMDHFVTISLGVASFSKGEVTPRQLLKAADESLYEAKRKGRDRCGSMKVFKK